MVNRFLWVCVKFMELRNVLTVFFSMAGVGLDGGSEGWWGLWFRGVWVREVWGSILGYACDS